MLAVTGCATTHAPFDARGAFADADSVLVQRIADGVHHTPILDGRGPWAIHVLSIDPRECRPLLDAVRPPPPLATRATRSSLAGDAVAINADFFVLPGAAS